MSFGRLDNVAEPISVDVDIHNVDGEEPSSGHGTPGVNLAVIITVVSAMSVLIVIVLIAGFRRHIGILIGSNTGAAHATRQTREQLLRKNLTSLD